MYSAKINGKPTRFGTSGLLYRSNKVMYDRDTNGLWNQFLGKPIVGPLVGLDVKLEIFPVALTTWGEWLQEHPDTQVLSLDTGYYSESQYQPEDDERSIYYEYRANPEPIFPILDPDERLRSKDEVLGLTIDGKHKAYPISVIQERRLVHDLVNDTPLVVLGSSRSSKARAYQTQGTEFSLPVDVADEFPEALQDEVGGKWLVTPDALVKALDLTDTRPALPTNVSFWFAWHTFHTDTELYAP